MNRFGTSLVQAFPINVAASFGCALASYYFLELPMAGLRKRLRPAAQACGTTPPMLCDSGQVVSNPEVIQFTRESELL
jgi:peptidoglycan/LPS O-acetylase OafA/YrhL